MKDYYFILGIPFAERNIDAITNAYKSLCADLHPDKYKETDCRQRTEEINEAYLVLSDECIKDKYDEHLIKSKLGNSNEYDSDLDSQINAKREEAKRFTSSFFEQYNKQKTQKSKFSWCRGHGIALIIFLVLSLLGIVVYIISNPFSFKVPDDWSYYEMGNAFSISVPPTLEVRHDDDPYTQNLNKLPYDLNNRDVIFQQKNLSNLSNSAKQTYCRILINYYNEPGAFPRYNETEDINNEAKQFLDEIVYQEVVVPSYLIGSPSYAWIDINGIKAIETSYQRKSSAGKGIVCCKIYLLSNYDELVKIVVAYREGDSQIWANDMSNVIKTFKWKNLK